MGVKEKVEGATLRINNREDTKRHKLGAWYCRLLVVYFQGLQLKELHCAKNTMKLTMNKITMSER